MMQDDKELLLKDLCARLPYGVKMLQVGKFPSWFSERYGEGQSNVNFTLSFDNLLYAISNLDNIKLYLRPMSSMTSKEWVEFCDCSVKDEMSWVMAGNGRKLFPIYNKQDFLNAHHFDYRGLISMGLALVATEGMYETE